MRPLSIAFPRPVFPSRARDHERGQYACLSRSLAETCRGLPDSSRQKPSSLSSAITRLLGDISDKIKPPTLDVEAALQSRLPLLVLAICSHYCVTSTCFSPTKRLFRGGWWAECWSHYHDRTSSRP